MKSKLSIVKSTLVAAALVAGLSGMARADDSSLNPFIGDSYAYFNAGNLPRIGSPVFDNSPSSWRRANAGGLSERELQLLSLSSNSHAYQANAAVDKAPSAWREIHPNGLSERELQELSASSLARAWQLPDESAAGGLASTRRAIVVTSSAK